MRGFFSGGHKRKAEDVQEPTNKALACESEPASKPTPASGKPTLNTAPKAPPSKAASSPPRKNATSVSRSTPASEQRPAKKAKTSETEADNVTIDLLQQLFELYRDQSSSMVALVNEPVLPMWDKYMHTAFQFAFWQVGPDFPVLAQRLHKTPIEIEIYAKAYYRELTAKPETSDIHLSKTQAKSPQRPKAAQSNPALQPMPPGMPPYFMPYGFYGYPAQMYPPYYFMNPAMTSGTATVNGSGLAAASAAAMAPTTPTQSQPATVAKSPVSANKGGTAAPPATPEHKAPALSAKNSTPAAIGLPKSLSGKAKSTSSPKKDSKAGPVTTPKGKTSPYKKSTPKGGAVSPAKSPSASSKGKG